MEISFACVAAAAAICGAGGRGAVPRAGGEGEPISNAVFAVTTVTVQDAGDGRLVAKDIVTPFGRSGVRSAEMVVDGADWGARSLKKRVANAITDLNFSHEAGGAMIGGEAALLFNRGFKALFPGPDLFVFADGGRPSHVRVSPIYRMPDDSLVEGRAIALDAAGDAIEIGGRAVYGVGIDLDEWTAHGAAPQGGVLAGATLRRDDGDAPFALAKIVLANGSFDGPLGPELSPFDAAESTAGELGVSDGLVRNGGGSGLAPQDDVVPAPGAGGAMLLAGTLAGLARPRRER